MSVARRIRTWAAALVAVAGTAAMQVHADTFYVNGACGNDDWTGTSSVCEAPDGPKATIQAGIDASVDGDTVIVADGTYTGVGNRDLDYAGRLVVVRSENGPQGCIIDCEANDADRHRAFNFHSGETLSAVVDGFTIQNGYRPRGVAFAVRTEAAHKSETARCLTIRRFYSAVDCTPRTAAQW